MSEEMSAFTENGTIVAEITPTQGTQNEPAIEPKWFTALSPDAQQRIRWVDVAKLTEHPACKFLPTIERSYATICKSVGDHGVLFPLAVDSQDQILDGRYRFRAAKSHKLTALPVITIDVDNDAAVQWVLVVKQDREHLSEDERAIMAVEYQKHLSHRYIQDRAKQMTAGRLGQTITKSPKRDSRQESCDKFKSRTRAFNKYKRLSDTRADLYNDVLAGKMEPVAALKKMGRNRELARIDGAIAAAKPVTIATGETLQNNIHCGDSVETMRRIPDGVASLVLYSPPYHGVDISYDPPLPQQTFQEYMDYQRLLLLESYRVVRPGGRIAIILDTVRNQDPTLNHHMLPVVARMTTLAIECAWMYMNELAWIKDEISGSKTAFGSLGLCSAPHFARNSETILLLYKEQYKLEGDPALSDFSTVEHLAWRTSAWHIKPEVDRSRRLIHPAPFPEEIPFRLIKMLTYRGDLVIDPYNGSGTTTAVAYQLGRRYIGIDQSDKYCEHARHRLSVTVPAVVTQPTALGSEPSDSEAA